MIKNIVLFMLFNLSLLSASVLSDSAAAMSVGWVKITTINADEVLETTSGAYDIFDNYSSQMAYDPISDAVYYYGGSHHTEYIPKFVRYDISTNTWSELTNHGNAIHGYDHNAVDNRRGVFYHRQASTRTVYRYTMSSDTWSAIADANVSYGSIADGFGYFSALDKLVYLNSNNNEIGYYDLKSNSWDAVQSPGISMGTYHAQACDLPKHGLFIFGGGNTTNNLWSIDVNKNITSIGNPTGSLSINVNSDGGNGCFFLQDPVSGDLLLFHDNGNVYQWNPIDGWSTVSGVESKMGVGSVSGHAGVSLPQYGVIMVVRRVNNTDVEVWLYKHAEYQGPRIPTIKDERDAYDKFGWDWSTATSPLTLTDPYSGTYNVSNGGPDIHGDTEADDFWTYLHMFDRGGNSIYYNRAKEWREYFTKWYRGDLYDGAGTVDESMGFCHMYGTGLVYDYWRGINDSTLAEAESLGVIVEDGWDGNGWDGSYNMKDGGAYWYGYRRPARQMLLATYLARATNSSRWASLRDTMINVMLYRSGWDKTYGTYFAGEYETDQKLGAGSYAAGYRYYWPNAIALLAEAFYNAYLDNVSQSDTIAQRLIDIAEFIRAKGRSNTTGYTGYIAGIYPDGSELHNGSDRVYTNALVNILVLGYKFTNDTTFLDSAKVYFKVGNGFTDNTVDHFVDTEFASSTGYFYLDNNRAELLYTYLLFENGGSPTILGSSGSGGGGGSGSGGGGGGSSGQIGIIKYGGSGKLRYKVGATGVLK